MLPSHPVMRFVCGAVGLSLAAAVAALIWVWASARAPAFMVPSPASTLARLNRGEIWQEAIASAAILLASFVRALVYALPVAILVGLTRLGFAVFFPVLRLLAMLPVVALLPLAVLWFGPAVTDEGVHGPSALAMLTVIAAGIAAVVHKAHDVPGRVASLEFPTGDAIRDAFRREARGMFRTFRRAIEIGAVTLIAHQFIVGKNGIGHLILNGAMMMDAAQVVAAILAAWAMVLGLELPLYAIEFAVVRATEGGAREPGP